MYWVLSTQNFQKLFFYSASWRIWKPIRMYFGVFSYFIFYCTIDCPCPPELTCGCELINDALIFQYLTFLAQQDNHPTNQPSHGLIHIIINLGYFLKSACSALKTLPPYFWNALEFGTFFFLCQTIAGVIYLRFLNPAGVSSTKYKLAQPKIK